MTSDQFNITRSSVSHNNCIHGDAVGG